MRRCSICAKTLTKEESVAWAESGLPVRFLVCGQHMEMAASRLREEVEAARRAKPVNLEQEVERLRNQNRHLSSAITDMAALVEDLQQKLRERGN